MGRGARPRSAADHRAHRHPQNDFGHGLLESQLDVYNIEVHGEHVFRVTADGVLVHNACPGSHAGITSKLSPAESNLLRDSARAIWQQLTGRRAIWDDLEVHHRVPLEWSHIFPKADPNRVSNLIGIAGDAHKKVTAAWAEWKAALGARLPTQAELIEQAMKIDRLFENDWVFPK